jgi:uncharacterized membrane protein YecN with MAPEG domain
MKISVEYTWTLLAVVLNVAVCFIQGSVYAGMSRKKVFGDKTKLPKATQEHIAAFPKDKEIPDNGYPDTGSGRYTDEVSFEDWMTLNKAQRIHGNYLEALPFIIIAILVTGLSHPCIAGYLGIGFVVGRIAYGIGYYSSPNHRLVGALISDLVILALLVFAGISIFTVLMSSKFCFLAAGVTVFALECLLVGFIVAGGQRSKFFSEEFLTNFFKD